MGGKRITEKQYHELAESRGGKCLEIARTGNDKSWWLCGNGHRFDLTYRDAYHAGRWCRYCAKNAPVTPDRYHAVAKERGGKCLEIARVTMEHSLWRCAYGHEWAATYNDIANNKRWCPYCSGNARVLPDRYHAVAKERGGKCIKVGRTTHDKSIWECSEGHRWPAEGDRVFNRGDWCPHCANRVPISPEQYHAVAKERGGKCIKVGRTTAHLSVWECSEGHRWPAPYGNVVYNGSWCAKCAKCAPITPEQYHAIAKERGGKCIKVGKTTHDKSIWECSEGHRWPAPYNSISHGNTWCGRCSGSIPVTPEQYNLFAKENDGACLEIAEKASLPSLWLCDKGHKFWRSYSSLKYHGAWCGTCSSSNSERAIANLLDSLDLAFRQQTSYDRCRNPKTKNLLYFDFEVTINGRIILIEFNGIQHYETVNNDFFGGDEALAERQYRDGIKKRFCKQNNIPLIIINYNVKDIADYLLRMLSKASGLSYGDLLDYGRKRRIKTKDFKFSPGKPFQPGLFGDREI